MIQTLTLRNFKVLREVEVKLRPLTLIVGPNASGKSTILEALALLTDYVLRFKEDLLRGRTSSLIDRARTLRSLRAVGAFRIGYSGFIGDAPFNLLVDLDSGKREGEIGKVSSLVLPAASLEFDVEKLAAPSYMKEVGYELPKDGSGLSSILAGFYLEHPDRYRAIIDRLKQVVPLVKDVRLRRMVVEKGVVGYELIFDTASAESVPAHSVSSGTLITLGLLTVLSSPEPPQLVLIDDLERGLHPKALGELIHQFRLLQEQNPELQIVATSHSPYLLDYVKAEEVLLTSLDQDGYAVVKSLTEHPEYERWKDLMAPGEFWSTVGESWVTVAPERSWDVSYTILEARFESGESDVAARHDEHQP